MNDTVTVEIPADVRDNSETVTDYAFMRHRSPDKGVRTPKQRDTDINNAPFFGYRHFTWHDVNPDGQRCRFDMLVDEGGQVVDLFHTEYFTRVKCAECEYSYAQYYMTVTTPDGTSEPVARCGEHTRTFMNASRGIPGVTVTLSEPLRIGQH